MPRSTPWADMPEEWKAEQSRKDRRRRYLRHTGRPCDLPADEVRAWVIRLHDEGGMSFQAIADAAGGNLNNATASDLYRGHRTGMRSGEIITTVRRKTHNLLMAVEMPAMEAEGSQAQVDACGSVRRLQALACAGYGALAMSLLSGRDHKQTWRDMNGRNSKGGDQKYVTVATRRFHREFYDKYIHTDPADVGSGAMSISRAKGMARRSNWAPEHCWDSDTIDDPNAFPEWTGECGNVTGYYLHLKYDILVTSSEHEKTSGGKRRRVLCQPCLDARAREAAAAGLDAQSVASMVYGTDEVGIADAIKADRTYRDIAQQFEVSCRTVQRVANKLRDSGQWTPNTRGNRRKDQQS